MKKLIALIAVVALSSSYALACDGCGCQDAKKEEVKAAAECPKECCGSETCAPEKCAKAGVTCPKAEKAACAKDKKACAKPAKACDKTEKKVEKSACEGGVCPLTPPAE